MSKAVSLGVRSIALTDWNCTSGAIDFLQACSENGIHGVIGAEYRNGDELCYMGFARSILGLRQLNESINEITVLRRTPSPRAPELSDVFFVYPLGSNVAVDLGPMEYVGVMPHQIHLWKRHPLSARHRGVAWWPVTLANSADYEYHKMLRAIDLNILFNQVNHAHTCLDWELMCSPSLLSMRYSTCPSLLEQAQQLLHVCDISWQQLLGANIRKLRNGDQDMQKLQRLAESGLALRYGKPNSQINARLQTELDLIYRLSYQTYFLIAYDIVLFARRMKYPHVGRGSGANSLVAYCLFITNVDPIRHNLYIERFINEHRPEPPDFDIDFSWEHRDEVIKYVLSRHGPEHVGLLCTYTCFKGKSTVREIGKALGLSKKEIDTILARPLDRNRHHPLADKIFEIGRRILQFPRHYNMHVGGVVVMDQPASSIVASEMMPKGFPVLQIDMHQAAKWRLHKLDILSQRGIAHIAEAASLVFARYGVEIDMENIDLISRDEATLDLLQSTRSKVGCFYIESPAMRGLLAKLQCKNYEELVAASSIIRPGVAKSGMMSEYIKRHRGTSQISYAHPSMQRILHDTYGIMVYQEDVMLVVRDLAGMDLSDGDTLRRLMTGKDKSVEKLEYLRSKFVQGCRSHDVPSSTAKEVWRQIKSFSGYAFCKAHSATYAAESMQSLFLKAHYPIEFLVSVINNMGGFYETQVYVWELMKIGVDVQGPCISQSGWLTRIADNKVVYLGLRWIKGLTRHTARRLADIRMNDSKLEIADIHDLSDAQLDLLIRSGACRSLNMEPERLQLAIRVMRRKTRGQLALFTDTKPSFQVEVSKRSRICQYQIMGLWTLNPHTVFDFCLPASIVPVHQKEMNLWHGKQIWMLGYYITEKHVTTPSGRHMSFVTWLDKNLDHFDSVHFPDIFEKHSAEHKGFYLLKGKVVVEWGYAMLHVLFAQSVLPKEEMESFET